MASHTADRGEHTGKGTGKVKDVAADVARTAAAAVDDKRAEVAEALDGAADAIGETGKQAPGKRYSRAAKQRIEEAADYVREHDAREIGADAARTATLHPLTSLFLLGVVVIGGSLLVASLLENEADDAGTGGDRHPTRLKSAAGGLGPKGIETLTRIRDAAFTFALARAVDTADEVWPGFRQHYERG
jgi:hypothetical protein